MANSTDVWPLLTRRLNGEISMCRVCPHHCRLELGQLGHCGVRVNVDGLVRPAAGQSIAALGVATVEEHPLFHFFPGARSLCIGSMGCTATCDFCQNWELALTHRLRITAMIAADPSAIVTQAIANNCSAISFTYNEAVVWLELVVAVMQAARRAGLKSVLITNGFISSTAWGLLLPWLDAVKLDLKSADAAFYRRSIGIELNPVLNSLARLREGGIWREISTVIIPGINDQSDAVAKLVDAVIVHSGKDTPWHLMRFFPAYHRIAQPPGSLETLRSIRATAMDKGLVFTYIGNVPDVSEANTVCAHCSETLSVRRMARLTPLAATCPGCHTAIPGRGLALCVYNG